MQPQKVIPVYLETGEKRTFACAVEWPGWSRSGRDEASALQALFDYGPRYAGAIRAAGLQFQAPEKASAFDIVERLKGNATTDFGAPDVAPSADAREVDDAELDRFQALMKACWDTFDRAVEKATGKELRQGPRGGGRKLQEIVEHVVGAEGYYLSRLGRKLEPKGLVDPGEVRARTRQAVLDGLAGAVHEGVPKPGPRGGVRWTPRLFVRRLVWHVLDHAWEIEDRAI